MAGKFLENYIDTYIYLFKVWLGKDILKIIYSIGTFKYLQLVFEKLVNPVGNC